MMEIKLPNPIALQPRTSAAAQPADGLQRRKLAQEFTAFLYQEILKAMRAATPQDGLVEGESMSRDFFTSMMDSEVARVVARRDSSGVAKAVEKTFQRIPVELNKTQPASDPLLPVTALPPTLPVPGRVSSSFGVRADPFDGQGRFHHGVDIAAPAGTPIHAVAPGRVVFSGVKPGYGNLIEVEHGGGWVTRYGHNSKNLVNVGDQVDAGRRIGLVGRTGRASGDHLHFEARQDGRAVDPKMFLAAKVKGTRLSSKV
jgi:murein DD-endopeptidase MepM/ murein hydrolase activator NlpD